MDTERGPRNEGEELACVVLAGAALEGLKDLADGDVWEGAELDEVLRRPLQRTT